MTAASLSYLALTAISGDVFQEARTNSLLGTVFISRGNYCRATAVLKQAIASSDGKLLYRLSGLLIASVRSRDWLGRSISCPAVSGGAHALARCTLKLSRVHKEPGNGT